MSGLFNELVSLREKNTEKTLERTLKMLHIEPNFFFLLFSISYQKKLEHSYPRESTIDRTIYSKYNLRHRI
jgi:hypothetical protein